MLCRHAARVSVEIASGGVQPSGGERRLFLPCVNVCVGVICRVACRRVLGGEPMAGTGGVGR